MMRNMLDTHHADYQRHVDTCNAIEAQARAANNAQMGHYPADIRSPVSGEFANEPWTHLMRAGPPNPQPRHNSPTPQAVALANALEAAAVALLNAVALLRLP